MTDILIPPVGPLVAARAYLLAELAARDNPLPVGVTPPAGVTNTDSYALLSRPGGRSRVFLSDYLIRVRVYDADTVRLESNADLIHRLMMTASHKRIDTELGSVWIAAATHQFGPASIDDPDIPLFGMQSAIFWTIGLRPEPAPAG